MYGAGMSDSNSHSPYNRPIVLLGGGAGQLAGGRHLVYSDRDRTPLANLHVTLLDKLGVPVRGVTIVHGKTAQEKTVCIFGLPPEVISTRLGL